MESRLHVLNEVYFGKTPEVLKIEKAIDDLRKKYLDEFRNINVNADPLKFKIEDAISEAFGFEATDLQIFCSETVNAMTMPIGWELDTLPSKNLIIHNKHGFKYKKEAGYATLIIIYTGLLLNSEISSGEVTAILLHEIGHNFTGGVFPTIGILQKIFLLPELIKDIVTNYDITSALLSTNFIIKYTNRFNKEIATKYKFLYYILNGTNMIFNTISDIESFIHNIIVAISPLGVLNAVPKQVIRLLLSPGRVLIGSGDESFADSFPAMYGYSEEIASGLSKMDTTHSGNLDFGKLCKMIPILGWMFDLSILPIKLVSGLFEEHSESCVRAVKTLNYLEYELEKGNHSQKIKARLKKDIAKTKKVLEDYEDFSNRLDHRLVNKLWAQIVLKTKFYALYAWAMNYSTPEAIDKQAKSAIANLKLK